jgi:F-type H+-transporting ATPase subunit b
MLSDAEEAKQQANADRETYAAQLTHAEEDAAEVIRRATQSANRTSDEIVASARTRAAELLKKADEDIEQEKKKAVNEMKEELSGISLTIAEKVVGREINSDDHRKFIDDFIGEVGEKP